MLWLLLYAALISLYDLRTHRIPNWASLPMLAVGLIAHLPGSPALWIVSLALLLAWGNHSLGGGDAKLWLAMLWALPTQWSSNAYILLFATFFITALLQIAWRALRGQPTTGSPAPAAWRTIPFLLACWYVH